MKTVLSYLLTPIYYFNFFLLLFIFQPIQMICYNIWGYNAHKRSVEILNFLLIKNFIVLGAKISFHGFDKIPQNRPLIIVSNHQSTYDIPPVIWGFRDHHAKFISKKELGKYIPSISYNLRKSGAALIDRKNGSQAIREILKLGKTMEEKKYSACIYPEGTRSIDGKVKRFRDAGIKTLLKASPSAVIVPFVIDGNYRLQLKGMFPLSFGERLKYSVLDPIEPNDHTAEELVKMVQESIKKELKQL